MYLYEATLIGQALQKAALERCRQKFAANDARDDGLAFNKEMPTFHLTSFMQTLRSFTTIHSVGLCGVPYA